MRRSLNKKDFVEVGPHFLELHRYNEGPFEWNVYEEYEAVGVDTEQRYLRTPDVSRIKHTYRPLIDSPHLFLEFARLMEQRDPGEALQEWISRRGLLGLHKRERPEEEYAHQRDYWWALGQGLTEYVPEGGPSERWREVVRAAVSANDTLRCWEAVLSRDPERAEQVARVVPPPDDAYFDPIRETHRDFCRRRADRLGLTYGEHLLHFAAWMASLAVQQVLEAFAFPYPAFDNRHSSERQSGPPGPELVTGSWQPRNLLGAMYLQMYQLMISSGELRSCRHCGRIFSLAPPMPGSKERKPHSKKKFCDDKCRQNYHYHNRIKPNRNGKS